MRNESSNVTILAFSCSTGEAVGKAEASSFLIPRLQTRNYLCQVKVRIFMKLYVSLVVSFIAFFSPQADANGVCYDPDHTSGKSALTVQADMKLIAGAGFTSVRTYISKFDNTELGPIITGAGFTVVLGVPYPRSDYLEQMEAAISAANAGGVSAIMVGNENLAGATSVPSGMIDVINQIKSRVSCKVGTVQRNTEVIGFQSISNWSELVSSVDILGVNVHPFFHPSTTADSAIGVVDKQWQIMMNNFGDKLLLTETGWPSEGSILGNIGSIVGEQAFYSAYQMWSSGLKEKFYFQFFDTPRKPEAFEQTYGLYTADSQPKFSASQLPQPTLPVSQPVLAPTPPIAAPAPMTAAPMSTINDLTQELLPNYPDQINVSSGLKTNQKAGSSEGNTMAPNSLLPPNSGNDNRVYGSNSAPSSTLESLSTVQVAEPKSIRKSAMAPPTESISSIGQSSKTQPTFSKGNNNAQTINNQSENTSSNQGVVSLAIGGGAFAMLVAFGFIYQARKRANGLGKDDKNVHLQVSTPAENVCSL